MEHSYKKAAAAVIALALIAAVILGIVLTSNTSPTAIPSGEAESSLSTVNAQIADVKIGAVDQVLNPEDDNGKEAVRNKWNKPGATVTPIADETKLKSFLGAGANNSSTNANEIGVLTKDITLNIAGIGDIGSSTFNGILDGNGYKITIKYTAGNLTIDRRVFLNANNDGIKANLAGGHHSESPDLEGIWSTGLLTGANRGTIANLVIDYESNMAMPTVVNGSSVTGGMSLLSGDEPQYISTYGIVTGANFGTIDNVRINVADDFVGRQQGSKVNAKGDPIHRNSRSWENTAIAGTLAGILVSGTVSNTYVDLGDGVTVGAFADGRGSASTLTAWRNGVAIAGGMIGFFIGNGGKLQDSYLSGTGTVAAIVGRGDNNGAGKGYNAFSGGVTGGKFKYSDGQADNGDMIDSSSDSVGDINAQIQGIVVSWTGTKRDNNNDNDEQRYDGGTRPKPYNPSQHDHLEPGTLIDTAKHQSTLSIALTYDYDSLFDGLGDGYKETGISNTRNVKDWTEIYSSGGDTSNRVEVKIEDGQFRVQAVTTDFEGTQSYRPLENEPNRTVFQTLPSGYTGEFIWSIERLKPNEDSSSTEMTMQDHTSRIGAMVYMIAYSQQSAFEIVFGTMAEYGVTYQESGRNFTAMMYDGNPVNTPTLSLTAAGEAVTAQTGAYSWLYQNGTTEVSHADTMYPGTYTFRPRYQTVDEEGEVTATYAYLDTTNHVVVPEGQGSPLTFNVLQASFDVTSAASNGVWTQSAVFNGALNTGSYAVYGQTAPSGAIFDSYTYDAANTTSAYQTMSGMSFQFTDNETTPAAGRVYNNFTVYKTNSAGEKVAVGSARTSLTVRIDNAAPVLEEVRYYTYSGDTSGIGSANVAEHYFNIKEGDPAYTDVTAKIGDGGWSTSNLFIVVTATDERRSGINSTSGVQVQLQAGGSGAPLSVQSQINYGREEGQDADLGTGNAAAIGYITSSATLQVQLRDSLTNSGVTEIGTINVDTVPLKLDNVKPGYTFDRGPATVPMTIGFGMNNTGITVGPSGAEIQYLIVDKKDIDATSTKIPSGYEDAWVKLADYYSTTSTVSYTIYESFEEGAAVFVRAVSKEGLYNDCTVRLYTDGGLVADKMEDGRYPYFYVDLVTASLLIPDEAILIDGVALSEIADKNAVFAKQYDGSNAFLALTDESLIGPQDKVTFAYYRNADGKIVERATGRIFKMVTIDWNKVTESLEGSIVAEAIAGVQANGYTAIGEYSQYENVGNTVLTWSFEVGNAAGNGYRYQLVFGDPAVVDEEGDPLYEREMIVDTKIDFRDYNIGVEGIVKGDADFEKYLDADANTVTTTYWGKNAIPFPFDFHASTGFGDVIYFRYAYIGGENGVFKAGGSYKIAVDAVKIVPEVGATADDVEWVEFDLNEDGSGDLPGYDNYNFHFTTEMKLIVEKYGVNIKTDLYRLENDGEGGQQLVPDSMTTKITYDGFTHVVGATYTDVKGERIDAVVKAYSDSTYKNETAIIEVGKYFILVSPVDTDNYEIKNNYKPVFEVVQTTIDIDIDDQSYEYNNNEKVPFVVRDGNGNPISTEGTNDDYKLTYYNENGIALDGAPTEIGSYEVYIVYTAGAGSNYSTGRFASRLEVTKATPRILGVTANSVVYDKGKHTYAAPDNPDDPDDGLKLASDFLDGNVFYFKDAETILELQYYNTETEKWEKVDKVNKTAGYFTNAGEYSFRYVYYGNANYNATTSDPVTFTINKAVYGTQSTIPTDFLLFKDNTNTTIPTAGTSGSGDDGLPIYTVDYNAKSQYLTAKSETFFDYSGAEPVAIEPGAEITYYREGNLLDTTRPETLNMQLAQDYLVTVTITSNNYQDFVYQMHYVIATIDIPQGAITVTTEGGVNITTGTSAEDPQPLSVTYDGKEHGYRADNSGEIIIKYDRTKMLEYDPENASSTPANASITYYPDGNQSNTLVDAGSYSGYYLISVGLTNYKPIRVYVTMTITPADAVATIEQDESITNVTSETNINNVISGTFIDVNGNEQQGTLVFTDASGNPATPDGQGRLPAGTYTVTVVDSSGNYVLKGETASLTIAEPDASHVHTDVDGNNVCDSCGANVTGIHVHVDADGDGICDGCKQQIGGEQPQPHDHVDANGDGKCDICGAAMDNQGGNDPVDDPDDGADTAMIVGGVLIGATALIVAGTVVGAILIVRKKRKNVI